MSDLKSRDHVQENQKHYRACSVRWVLLLSVPYPLSGPEEPKYHTQAVHLAVPLSDNIGSTLLEVVVRWCHPSAAKSVLARVTSGTFLTSLGKQK